MARCSFAWLSAVHPRSVARSPARCPPVARAMPIPSSTGAPGLFGHKVDRNCPFGSIVAQRDDLAHVWGLAVVKSLVCCSYGGSTVSASFGRRKAALSQYCGPPRAKTSGGNQGSRA